MSKQYQHLESAVVPEGFVLLGLYTATGVVKALTVDVNGNLNTTAVVGQLSSNSSSSPAQGTIGTTAGQILAANANRKKFTVQNTGTTVIKIVLGGTSPTQTAYTVALPAQGTNDDGSSPVYTDSLWIGAVQAISSLAGGTYVVTEYT